MRARLLILASAAVAVLIFIIGKGRTITGCMGLEQADNDACQAAHLASLPLWEQLWASPAFAIVVFLAASALILLAHRFARAR